MWTPPSLGGPASGPVHLRAAARVDFLGVPGLQPSLWVEHHDKRVGTGGPGHCFEGTDGTSPDGTPLPCTGERSLAAGRVRWAPSEALSLAVQYQHTWMGSPRHPDGWRQQGRGTLETILRPVSPLRLHGRAGWQDEVLADGSRMTRALRTSLEVAWALLPELGTRARYELTWEPRADAVTRSPSEPPRHLFRLELEGRL